MADLLTPLKTTWKTESSVEKSDKGASALLQVSSRSGNGPSQHGKHKNQSSTAFLQQVYLHDDSSSATLPDEAREILKCQPDHEDFVAVLQYLHSGIVSKHGFNIRASGPKASQILNVLVTVIIPDRWATLNTKPVSKQDQETRNMLLSCLTSVAGLGALHMQIRKLTELARSRNSGQTMMLNDAIDVLAHVLSPSSVIEIILRDTLKLQQKSARRHVLWQELCSYLAAGKVLSAVAQAFPLAGLANGKGHLEWLADGKQYTQWLARNICHAAMATAVAENEAWSMLAQLLKRSLSLGQSGKPRVLSCCQLCSY
jgi:telomere length regulation protein